MTVQIIKISYKGGNKYEIRQDSRWPSILEFYKNGKFVGMTCLRDVVNSVIKEAD